MDALYSTQSVLKVLAAIRALFLGVVEREPTLPELMLVLKQYEQLPDTGDEIERIALAIVEAIPAPELTGILK